MNYKEAVSEHEVFLNQAERCISQEHWQSLINQFHKTELSESELREDGTFSAVFVNELGTFSFEGYLHQLLVADSDEAHFLPNALKVERFVGVVIDAYGGDDNEVWVGPFRIRPITGSLTDWEISNVYGHNHRENDQVTVEVVMSKDGHIRSAIIIE